MGRKARDEKVKGSKSIFRLFKKAELPDEDIKEECAEATKKGFKVIIAIALVILIIIVALIIFIMINKNDGERIAISLSEKLGSTAEKAAANANVKLKKTSNYNFINDMGGVSDIYESKSTIKINGINVPEWVILCYSDKNGKLEEVSYFNYKILKNNINGMKSNGRIDIDKIEDGFTIEETEKILNLEPIQVMRNNDDKKIYKYKYFYEDSKTKNEKSYYITIMLNFDDKVMAVQETEDNYITKILSLE
ncbi:MAG: hypothetical protein GX365_06020 [Clostridiales bacterium]|nr:hypothetical protein [Clostridiales bacterium]